MSGLSVILRREIRLALRHSTDSFMVVGLFCYRGRLIPIRGRTRIKYVGPNWSWRDLGCSVIGGYVVDGTVVSDRL